MIIDKRNSCLFQCMISKLLKEITRFILNKIIKPKQKYWAEVSIIINLVGN